MILLYHERCFLTTISDKKKKIPGADRRKMSKTGLSALALEYCGASYTVPYYTLPWNLFFSKVRPYPFYEANTLTNIAVREANSPLTYDAQVALRALPANFSPITPTAIYALPTIGHVQFYNPSQKVLFGRNVNGEDAVTGDLTYQYNVTARLVREVCDNADDDTSSTYVISIDLNVNSGFFNLDVANDGAGDHKAAGGSVNGKEIVNVQPLGSPLPSDAQYLITGNRIWFIYEMAEDVVPEVVTISLNFQIIERPVPVTICDLATTLITPSGSGYKKPCCQ